MNKRNWSDLSRKLVDRFDLKYTSDAYESILSKYANGFFGKGVLSTTLFPLPFQITMSAIVLGGASSNGIAFDENGQLVQIDNSAITPKTFSVLAADPIFFRYDLLVLRHKESGATPIPKPSDPILTVNLNLVDDFELIVRPGVPSALPVYPAALAGDIILCGLQVPPLAVFGTQLTVDLGIRDLARANFTEQAIFRSETPAGVIDGVNNVFELSREPYGSNSLFLFLDNGIMLSAERSLAGSTITTLVAPAAGQSLWAIYIEQSPTSINPLSGFQEVPIGTIDGINDTFTLSGQPSDYRSTSLYVNRLIVENTNYDLIQTNGVHKIKFHSGFIPFVAQDIYLTYFVNPASVGIAGGGGGGGATPSYVPNGTPSAPQIVNGAAGVLLSSDLRQIIWLKSSIGMQVVTANPQIQVGMAIGQELVLIGTSDADYITLQGDNGNSVLGLALNGNIDLKKYASITLVWDGSLWNEKGRK